MAFSDPGLRTRLGVSGASRRRLGFVAMLGAALVACATPGPAPPVRPPQAQPPPAALPAPIRPPMPLASPRAVRPASPLQCVPYARVRSGITIYGDARTWYDQAQSRYPRASVPSVGSVIVLGGTPGGHVAVVAAILSAREILVDHANWANDGAIHLSAPMRDVSEGGDWSAVRVWHMASGQLGARIYPVRGFILPMP